MRYIRYVPILAMVCIFSAQASSFVGTTNGAISLSITKAFKGSTGASTDASDATTDASKRDKIIEQAQNDAAAFVGTQGKVRGVYLETAIQHIRQANNQTSQVTDLELAQAILAY